MNKKEIQEIKRRFKKDAATFTRLCGCYVDADRNKVVKFGQTFLNLDDEELHKYLEITKKVLSGSLGNNLLELEFPAAEEAAGGKQQFLLGLRQSLLKSEELLDAFFDLIIENYNYVGNYLILIFHDAYDVMTKTTDNNKLDESEEVYEYLLCAVCPVTLSNAALGYREAENRIGPRIRDWVVGAPDSGFVFPAFTDRSADIHSVLFYTRDTKSPHAEFMENVLGCSPRLTATEKKLTFQNIVKDVIGEEDETSRTLFMDIHGNLNDLIPVLPDDEEPQPVIVTQTAISEILSESGVSEEQAAKIEKSFGTAFEEELPNADQLVDPKLVEQNGRRKEKLELLGQVASLKQQLEETRALPVTDADNRDDVPEVKTYDVILRVKPEKVSQIHSDMINGQKCLIIPLDENEHAAVNGVNTTV